MELPASFTDYTRALLGDDEYEQLFAALQQEPPVSIRLNESDSAVLLQRSDAGSRLTPVLWAPSRGYYLDGRLTFTFDPLFHAGCYYVQEASSMFVEQALRQYVAGPVVMLDLCAAPGGKSTHARSVLPEGSLLVANEVIRSRSQILAENLTKWGHPDVVVTNNDPSDFASLPGLFDVILTDVPCSGEGMFRKDSAAVGEWSPENVEICWQRQRRIVTDVWDSLKPGGILIYSTCTYNTKENEENIRWIRQEFGAEPLPLDVPEAWNITGDLLAADDEPLPVYRFLPHKTKGEGFFLAVLRKPGDADEAIPCTSSFAQKNLAGRKKNKKGAAAFSPVSKEQLATTRHWLRDDRAEDYLLLTEGTEIYAFPQRHADLLSFLKQHLRLVSAGVSVAEVKGKDLIPSHALAICFPLLQRGAFAEEELNYEQAIAYLRKEAVALPPAAPRGYLLLTYHGIPLGFAKNIGNRANNLYPQEWRIRSGYLPEEVKVLG